jgi:hypothetical protein
MNLQKANEEELTNACRSLQTSLDVASAPFGNVRSGESRIDPTSKLLLVQHSIIFSSRMYLD